MGGGHMRRIIYETGLTSFPIAFGPGQSPYKWIIESLTVFISLSSTTGTRTLVVFIFPDGKGSPSIALGATASATLTSGNLAFVVSGYANAVTGVTGSVYSQWSTRPELSYPDSISIQGTLLSGDTLSYILIFDEVRA